LVELASRQGRIGWMCRRCDRLRGELTLGSVIFQLVFFLLEDR
jgi:hypothetical protein